MKQGDDLAGKVALVTGGARNIGRAISQALAAGGASVMVNVNTSLDMARETVALIEDTGGTAAYCVADITDPEDVERLVATTVERFGRLDILVNNAGTRSDKHLEEITYEEWREVLKVIVDGPFLVTKAALPHLIESGSGSIVNLGGMTAHLGGEDRAHVITGKAAIAGMTKAFAHDLARYNINVNNVVPGLIETVRGLPGAPPRPPSRSAPPLIGRRGEPSEVAAMVRHLCGPDGHYITGQSIHVNGGAFMS